VLSLTKREKIALVFLSVSFMIGSVLTAVERRRPGTFEDFHVSGSVYGGSPEEKPELRTAAVRRDLKLDINSATAEEFQTLPRIGPKLAERIVRWRELHGPFASVRDLLKVDGIGEKTIARIEHLVEVRSSPVQGGTVDAQSK